ncbi:MAG: hypothetical protein U1E36_06440 [Rickettsiales bacterium]
MSDWVTRAFSKNSTSVVFDEKLLDEEVVILMQGKNTFNDPVYSYVKLSLRNLQKLKNAMKNKERFVPSDFGSILSAGTGEPSAELRSEMAVTYGLVDVPKPVMPKINISQPSVWDEDD